MEAQRRKIVEKRKAFLQKESEREDAHDGRLSLILMIICFTTIAGIYMIGNQLSTSPCKFGGSICRNVRGSPLNLMDCRVKIICPKKTLYHAIKCFEANCVLQADVLVHTIGSTVNEPSTELGIGILLTSLSFLALMILVFMGDITFDELPSRLFGFPPRGLFIAFEGIDGSGKSTQVESLVADLRARNYKVQKLSFPDRTTETGRQIDSWLKKEIELTPDEINSLFERNLREKTEFIEQTLKNGVWIVADRYYPSTVSYARARTTVMTDEEANAYIDGLIEPDVIFYLDINPEIASARIFERDSTISPTETTENLNRVYKNYIDMQRENWFILDGTMLERSVHAEIIETLSLVRKLRYSSIRRISVLSSEEGRFDEFIYN